MILEKRDTFILHLPTSSVEVLFKFIIRPLTWSSLQSFTSGQVKLQVVKSNGDLSHLLARLRPFDGLCSFMHSQTRFLWVWVYLQLFLTFSCKRTTTRCVCWQQHTRSNGDFCRLANRNNRLWHLSPSAWSSDALTTAAPVDLSLSPPPGLTLALLASAPLCRPLLTGLSLRSYCVLAEALQRLAASFISDLFNHSKSPFSLMSEVVWPEVVFLNRAPAAAGRSWSLMCRDARLKQALRTLHVGEKKSTLKPHFNVMRQGCSLESLKSGTLENILIEFALILWY